MPEDSSVDQPQRRATIDTTGATILIAFSALLGLNQALVKIVNDGFSPLFQSGLRSACAFVLILVYAIWTRKRMSISDGSFAPGTLNGVLFAAEFGLLFVALDFTTVARVSLFFYVMPVWVCLGAHFLIPEERLNTPKIIGLSLAVSGVAIAFFTDLSNPSPTSWIGDLLALGGGMLWAGIALLTRVSKLSKATPEMILLYQLGVSALILVPLALLFGDIIRTPNFMIYSVFVFQVVFIASIGFLVWIWVLSIYPVSNMSSFSLLAPIFGIFFGWMLFSDPLPPSFILAGVVTGSGLLLINRPDKRPPSAGHN